MNNVHYSQSVLLILHFFQSLIFFHIFPISDELHCRSHPYSGSLVNQSAFYQHAVSSISNGSMFAMVENPSP